jgi:hypothetical protein
MKKILLFIFIIISPIIRSEAQTGWVEKKSEIGNFSLRFPSTPVYSQGAFHGWKAKDKNGQVTYLMSYLEAPSNGQMTIAVAEKHLLSSMFEGDIQVSKIYLKYSGFNALDFLYKTTTNPTLFKQGRLIVKGQKVYILQVLYYHKNLAYFDTFATSLKLH